MVLHRTSGRWRLGLSLTLATALFWATLPIALKIALEILDPITLTWFRFVVAMAFTAAWLGARGRLRGYAALGRRQWWMLGAAASLLLGNYVFYLLGVQHTTPSNAQLLIQFAPLPLGQYEAWAPIADAPIAVKPWLPFSIDYGQSTSGAVGEGRWRTCIPLMVFYSTRNQRVAAQEAHGRRLRSPTEHARGNEQRIIQAHIDRLQRAHLAALELVANGEERKIPAVVKINHQLDALFLLGGKNAFALLNGRSQRLFAQDVLACFDRGHHNIAVGEVGSRDRDGLDLGISQQLAPIAGAFFGAIFPGAIRRPLSVRVAYFYQACVRGRLIGECVH
jgi:hypothetical protein